MTLRRQIEDAIEALVALLDALDGDPDREADLDAETGTWPEAHLARVLGSAGDENLEDSGDDEPSLGAPEAQFLLSGFYAQQRQVFVGVRPLDSQASWARGRGGDLEADILDEPHDAEEGL